MISQELQKKIEQSIKLLQTIAKKYDQPIEVAYSGGKDSDVILQLAKEAGIKYRAIYKNTTIDPPGTIAHAKEMGAEMRYPDKTFFELVAKMGLPNRRTRFCCKFLKEYKVLDKVIVGVRAAESTARAARYTEPTQCRIYSKTERVEQIFPILDWTDKDVADFIADRNIKCAPVYYDEQGKFRVERRLGCMCCPMMYYKKRIAAFKQYPGMVRQYIRNLQKFWDNSPSAKCHELYPDVYAQFYRDVFCDSQEDYDNSKGGLFEQPDYKAFLEQYFGVSLA